jgi:hypothetical protein
MINVTKSNYLRWISAHCVGSNPGMLADKEMFEALMAENIKTAVFWAVMPYSL